MTWLYRTAKENLKIPNMQLKWSDPLQKKCSTNRVCSVPLLLLMLRKCYLKSHLLFALAVSATHCATMGSRAIRPASQPASQPAPATASQPASQLASQPRPATANQGQPQPISQPGPATASQPTIVGHCSKSQNVIKAHV